MGSALIILGVSSVVGAVSFVAGWLFGRSHSSEETLMLTDQLQHLAELAESRREQIEAVQAKIDQAASTKKEASLVERFFR